MSEEGGPFVILRLAPARRIQGQQECRLALPLPGRLGLPALVAFLIFLWTSSVFDLAGASGVPPVESPPMSSASWGHDGRLPPATAPIGRRWERVPVRLLASESSAPRAAATWWIRMFRKYVSPVDGPSCSFSPTCSAYGMKAIERHGLLRGIPMTAERLMRDHRPHNPDRYPLLERDGELYYQDPVEANDFWWSREPVAKGELTGAAETIRAGSDNAREVELPPAAATAQGSPDPARQIQRAAETGDLAFALDLYGQGYWEEAALEFRRFCFLHPGHSGVPEARLLIGKCREQQGRTADAIREYQRLAGDFPETPAGEEALVRIGEALYRAARFEEARVALQRAVEEGPSRGWTEEARYRMAWSSLELHAFTAARDEFEQLQGRESPYRGPAREMVEGIDGIVSLRYRSPFLAGLLSGVLPGTGQVYTGSYKDGLLAFLVNGALAVAAYEAFDKEVYVAGGLASAVGLTFYLGGVYGAVNSAHRANQEGLAAHLRPYRDRLEWFSPEGGR